MAENSQQNERKFQQDKVYLQGPDGQIWDYEPMLAAQEGYKQVIPNQSRKSAAKGANVEDSGKQQSDGPQAQTNPTKEQAK